MATNYLDKGSNDQQIAENATDLLGKKKWEDGNEWVYAYASGTLVANTPYVLKCVATAGQNPNVAAAADGAYMNLVVVPTRALVAGDTDWFKCKGPATLTVPSATYTAGDGLKIHDAAVTDMGAAHTNSNNEFAVITTGGTTVTSITAFLTGREALGTT